MAKRLIPSLNRVLVEKLLQPKKSAGGILLPETTKQVRGTQISLVSIRFHWLALAPSARDSFSIFVRAAFVAWSLGLWIRVGEVQKIPVAREGRMYRELLGEKLYRFESVTCRDD